MGLFEGISGMFKSATGESLEGWTPLGTEEAAETVLSEKSGVQVIFKHSPYCGTSMFAMNAMHALDTEEHPGVSFYWVDVIAQRNVSQYIERETGLRHESPQVLVLLNGEVYWHSSHSGVTTAKLKAALESL